MVACDDDSHDNNKEPAMKRRQLMLGASSALLASLALPARARDDDDGEFTIQHARYGTEHNHVDVTGRLRDLARQDRRFRLENDVFGVDPEPGRIKTLRIYARDRQGRERTFEYREHDWVDGNQFTGWRGGNWGHGNNGNGNGGWQGGGRDEGQFTILRATYGTSRREVDVTDRLRDLARQDQRLRMGNDTFGVDPDPGRIKRLRIVARDRGGREQGFEYREDAVVDGSQFIGWSRGDWGPSRPGGSHGRLVIESASYGADGRWVDVTQAVRRQVRGERLDVQVGNDWLGVDPLRNRRKVLSITYRWSGDRANTVQVNEGDRIRLP